MQIDIPGYRVLTIENVVMDFNGTIAVDGRIKDGVRQRIVRLAEYYPHLHHHLGHAGHRGPGSWRACR
jgi:hypothetical protein